MRAPATTFVITHSPSRSNRWDGRDSSGMQGGRRSRSDCWQVGPGASRMTIGHLLSTKHPTTPLACALSLDQEFESLRARHGQRRWAILLRRGAMMPGPITHARTREYATACDLALRLMGGSFPMSRSSRYSSIDSLPDHPSNRRNVRSRGAGSAMLRLSISQFDP